MNFLKNSTKQWASRFLELFLVAALGIMLGLVFLNVILRYCFDSGVSFSDEISRFLFVWLTFLGALLALRDHQHLGVDLITRKLSYKGRFICSLLSQLLMMICCYAFLIGSWRQVWINLPNKMPVTGLPLGLMYAAGVICAFFMLIILLWRIIRLLRSKAWLL